MYNFFWHNLKVEEIVKILRTDIENGLSEREVEISQKEFGRNVLPEEKFLSGLTIFLDQFKSPLIYILLIAGIVTLFLKDFTDAMVIFGAVFVNVSIGYFQERKASNTLRALKKIVKHQAEVLREGNLKMVESSHLVSGDIIILNPGDRVPADGRIIENHNLKINEMALTGEWLPAQKSIDILPKDTPLADRDNMIYMGTVVENGKAKAVVTSTGIQTEIGKIAILVKESREEKTPYQKKLARFSLIVGILMGLISVGIFIEGILTGGDFREMFIMSVAVAVAAIPEGLPVAMTVILALGMQRILKQGGLIRKLTSVETLGSTSVICTDKTATLTEGKMKVDKVITPTQILKNRPDLKKEYLALQIAALTSEAFIENFKSPKNEWILRGRPTDKALLEAGIEKDVIKKAEEEGIKKIIEMPFTTINKYIAAVFEKKERNFLYICGAPERILEKCSFFEIDNEKFDLDQKYLEVFEQKLKKLAGAGLRVVAMGYKIIKGPTRDIEKETNDLFFAGFIALKDPVRKEVKEALEICREAGIRVIMATGDHALTAKAVAREIGFDIKRENVLEGKELDKLSEKEFKNILDKIKIYARVEPKHKMRIIEAWQERGEVVAMTGDGINDAPALKKADIGVAIGSGTEVAKQASDLVLLNDNFSIIVKAIEEGRAILDNIRKVITYLLSDSFTEVVLIMVSLFAKLPLPITAVQILWVNLIEDGLPDMALAFEPKEKDLMKRKPVGQRAPLLTKEMKTIIFIIGILTDLLLLGLFFWLLANDKDILHIRTMIFACLSIDSLLFVFSCKNLRKNLWHINLFSNKLLIIAFLIGATTLIMAIYLPLFQTFLKTVPLHPNDWLIILGLGMIEMILIEGTKWYFISRHETEI